MGKRKRMAVRRRQQEAIESVPEVVEVPEKKVEVKKSRPSRGFGKLRTNKKK